MIKNLKENFISISLYLLIFLIVINTILIIYNRNVMVTNNILQKQSEEVKKAWTEVFDGNLRRMDLGLRGYALTKNPQLLEPYVTGKRDMPRTVRRIDSLLTVQQLDTLKDDFEGFKVRLDQYMAYTDEMKNFAQQDNLEDFIRLLNEDRGYGLWAAFAPMYTSIMAYEDRIVDQARDEYQQALNRTVIFGALLVLLTLPTLIALMYKIKRESKARIRLLQDFEQNTRQYMFDPGEEVSAYDAQAIIQTSIKNLKKASTFIKNIAAGNYGVNWEGMTNENAALNQENLAGDLIKMRDQMKKVKELDEKRIWSTEGLAKFSDVARNNQNNIEKLSNEVIRFLTKHMKAQQGSLFILHDDEGTEPYLELAACFAFDKKKFIERRIEIGNGLVGQAYMEGGTILLTDVPPGYIHITSGLGDATPTCVIIVPMKYNDRVEAVLELATFTKFEPHEVEFLEKAGEVIASSMYSTKTNERTSKLLRETQEQAETLRSQEEELRQNMEELQATQEDMVRKGKDTVKR
jgi:CHASE3 domain sensor protein